MFEKDFHVSILLDLYGPLLNERKRGVLDMYYNEDFSLAEISEQVGISRQGVRDIIRKSKIELNEYETRLGLQKKYADILECTNEISSLASESNASDANEILSLAERIKKLLQ